MNESGSPKKLEQHFRVVWKRKWLILALLVLGLGGAVLYYSQQTPMFRIRKVVRLGDPSQNARSSEAAKLLSAFFDAGDPFEEQFFLLKDPDLKERTATRIAEDDDRPHLQAEARDGILEFLKNSVEVKRLGREGSNVAIFVVGPEPEALPWVAEQIWQTYLDLQEIQQRQRVERGVEEIANLKKEAEERYNDADDELRAHLEFGNTTEIGFANRREKLDQKDLEIQEELDKLDRVIALEGPTYEGVKEAEAEGDSGLADFFNIDFVALHPDIREKRLELEQIQADAKSLRAAGFGPADARAKNVHGRMTKISVALRDLQLARVRQFIREHEGKLARHAQLLAAQDELNKQLAAIGQFGRKYEQLRQQVEIKRSRLDKLRDQHDRAVFEMANSQSQAGTILFNPTPAKKPFSPNLAMNLGVGALLGLLLGMGLAFALQLLDDSFRTEDDIEQILKLPCLGVIHTPESRRGGTPAVDLASVVDPRSIFAEEFRSIRTSLGFTFDRRRERHYALTVSSFEVREGKTTVSSNLATVIAASGLRTLLVDADMRNGRIHRTFGLPNDRGLSDLLAGKVGIDDVVEETEISNLSVLPAGALYDNPAEMLESPQMREFLDVAAERFDRIVFDSPPAGIVTDAVILAKQTDAVILVAAAGKARKRLLKRTVKNMLAIGVRIAGVVLNEMKPGRKRYYRKYLHLYRREAS
jgi:capsular exopolysaccharide synthesis family protein